MRPGQRERLVGVAVSSAPLATRDAPGQPSGGGWDMRLYAGLRVPSVPDDLRGGLVNALGQAGVEAEFLLALLRGFGGPGMQPHARGEVFLLQLQAAGRRLCAAGDALEIAIQGFLNALEAAYPGLRGEVRPDEVWWPPASGDALPGEAIELRLRRCGYAYRHVIAAHLGITLEAIAEQMTQLLHALSTLPPAGVVPAGALYAGLYEISSSFQGYTIPTHIMSLDQRAPGLFASIARLRALDAREDTSLAADIAWAHAQYALARAAVPQGDTSYWGLSALRDWQHVLADLESLQLRSYSGRRA
jgi:hypothetical protein